MSAGRSRRGWALVVGLATIAFWQFVFFQHGDPDLTLQNEYRLQASNGVAEWQPEFVYFLYHLDLYPVVSLSESPRVYSEEGARQLIRDEGSSLAMDRYWTVRYGDLAKTYLYLPSAWARGRPARPRMLHANAIGFTLALLALFTALWHVRKTGLAVALVLLLGSNPFQVTEVYANNNLFGWPITMALLLLALHIPLLHREESVGRWILLLAALSGLLLGTIRHVRAEPTLVIFGVAAAYLAATRLRLPLRLAAVVVLGGTFVATASGWTAHFDAKFREAQRVVRAAGGHVYNGPRHTYHFFWHALWCGLGDFDQKYGHKWSDITAFSYAWSIQQQQRRPDPAGYPPLAADATDVFSLGVYWDEGRKYPRTPYETEEYLGIIRGKLLRDIVHDPGWYLGILARRLGQLLSESTPPSIALGNGAWLALPGRGLWGHLGVGAALLLLRRRDWFGLKLVGFVLPLAGTALVVYSGGGTPRYSIAHLVALALGSIALLEALQRGRLVAWRPNLEAHVPARSALVRFAAAAGAAVLLLWGGWAVARRLVPIVSVPAARPDALHLAVLRFENATSDEGLAWYGDAVGDAVAATLRDAGLRVLDPDAAENLDANLLWWGPYGVPSAPFALAANVAADRSGAERVLLGRVRPGPQGTLACTTLFSAKTRRAEGPELCEPVSDAGILVAARRLADEALRSIGAGVGQAPVPELGAAEAESLRLYTEACRAIRRQQWGEADRLLGSAHERGSLDASTLRARVRAQWQPLDPGVLEALTGSPHAADALGVLRKRLAANPASTQLRVVLGRVLAALELFAEAQEVLEPLRWNPGTPPEAYGILAEILSARGELDRGYLALREYLRRSWREPRAESLLAQHLVRWQDLEGATQQLDDAAKDRHQRGAVETTLDDLVTRWRIEALRDGWQQAEQLAYRMAGVDDPRAEGIGGLHLARTQLFRGRSRLAQALAEEAAFRLLQARLDPAPAVRLAAELALEQGEPQAALQLLRELRPGGPGDPRSVALEALVLARAGRRDEAFAMRRRLATAFATLPGPTAQRALHQLDGDLALLHSDASAAVRSFSRAERMLAPRGFCGDHAAIWYGLGRAYRAANDAASAETWFRRVAESPYERLCWPIPYARSLAELGRVQAESGRDAETGSSAR